MLRATSSLDKPGTLDAAEAGPAPSTSGNIENTPAAVRAGGGAGTHHAAPSTEMAMASARPVYPNR